MAEMAKSLSKTNLLSPLAQWYETHLGEKLSPEKLGKFKEYLELLQEWNQKLNLTAITEPAEMVKRHLIDSLSCRLAVEFKPGMRVLDVGTGAGLPGIPLIIAEPGLHVYLLETIGKKAQFLSLVREKLQLENLNIINERAELAAKPEYPITMRDSFDIVVSRALAKLPTGVEYCLPFVKLNGIYLVQLGEDAKTQIGNALYAITELGGQLEKIIDMEKTVEIPHRSCTLIRKVIMTPSRYPRKPGLAYKRPITPPKPKA